MAKESSRLVFLDILRGWAVLVMIEVHVFNAFVLASIREEGWFNVLNYINGLVAPSFIFISGFVFMVAAQRKLEEYRLYGRTFWRQLGRIGMVWVVGYFLHLPFFSLQRTLHETTDAGWLKFYQADVLHAIALGLLLLFLLRLAIRRDEMYARVVLLLGVAFTAVAPWIWDWDASLMLPRFLAAYVNGQHYSQFPVFPWLGFMMGGGFFAARFLSVRGTSAEKAWFKNILIAGLIMISIGYLIRQVPIVIPGASLNIRANPLFIVERLGIVLVLLAACRRWELWKKPERSFVIDAGRESLVVYTVHLLVIYGQFWNERSLSFIVGKSWNVPECIFGTLLLGAAMVMLARFWSWMKRDHPPMARLGFVSTALGAIVGFLSR